jgi:hypothetical protein
MQAQKCTRMPDGMKLLRDRDKDGNDEPGDDVGESHDKQTEIPDE